VGAIGVVMTSAQSHGKSFMENAQTSTRFGCVIAIAVLDVAGMLVIGNVRYLNARSWQAKSSKILNVIESVRTTITLATLIVLIH
jgi:hypothetical protein